MTQFLLNILLLLHIKGILAEVIVILSYFVLVLIFIIINVMIIVWLERKICAAFQERLGPNRVGPFGLFQSVVDAVKLLSKEIIRPTSTDKWVYLLAPAICFISALLLYPILPFGKGMVLVNLNLGLLYFVAISSTTTISIIMAGWGSNNKYSLLGGMRTVAQMISYEMPLIFSMLGVIMLVGSLNLVDIVNAQEKLWFIHVQPLAFLIFLVASIAELNRAPFDLPEAEQELVAGYHTEYSGMQFAFFYLAEYANLFSLSILGVTMFLGGYQGPFFPSWIWLIVKVYGLMIIYMWIRWTLPRIRMDKMMKLNWKFLIPLSLFNILATGFMIKAWPFIQQWIR